MDELEKKLKNLKHISLSRDEREKAREMLSQYSKIHPVRDGTFNRPYEKGRESYLLLGNLKNLVFKPMPTFLVAAIITLTAGGGISLAAEGAVPGDPLYPVKVSVNEQVRSAVAVSDEAEAKWQVRLAERRLEEVEQLAVEGSLSSETRTHLEERFSAHIEEYEERAEAASDDEEGAKESAELSARLLATLEAHENVLAELTLEGRIESAVKNEVNAISARIRSALAEHVARSARMAADMGSSVEATGLVEMTLKATSAVSAEDDEEEQKTEAELAEESGMRVTMGTEVHAHERMRVAARMLESAEARFERLRDDMSVGARARISAKVSEANRTLLASETAFEAKEYGESLELSRGVMRLSTEIRVESHLAATLHARFDNDEENDSDERAEEDGKDSDANGRDGRDGRNGEDGQDGENGKDGESGEDGEDGRDGTNGRNGASAGIDVETEVNTRVIDVDSQGRVRVQF